MPASHQQDDADAAAHVVAEYNRRLGANDVEGGLALCAEDARLLPPAGPVQEGKAALRAFIDGWPTYKKRTHSTSVRRSVRTSRS